ncbi:hypothetical protein JZ751_027145 [Albula glossodonta]|uniref:PAS domain-containing protein n=1 Tax=Albula glossodonta TaxID=121402 RepID=A0A8T2NCQ0_9TELE|nr:hypothetical protein JZ751_027145 [Albula glossodonta]
MVPHRSTKGASKARRDHINEEIRNMRHLLPIAAEDRERLQGKLIYVSENVTEYLGFTMVDLLQGDSFYDMIERKDVDSVKSQLEVNSMPEAEKEFVCRMHTSKSFRLRHSGSCTMLVRGRFKTIPQSPGACPDLGQAFVALCTPTVNRLKITDFHRYTEQFQSVHQLDMTLVHISESAQFYLGYSMEDIIGQSWYSLLYPEDLALGAEAHKVLLQVEEGTQVQMVLRLQCRDVSWKQLYIRAAKDCGKQTVTCTNYLISETEATFLMQKIYTDVHEPTSSSHLQKPAGSLLSHVHSRHGDSDVTGLKRQRLPGGPSGQPQNKARRLSDPDVSCMMKNEQVCDDSSLGDHKGVLSSTKTLTTTPPCSPVSSCSPIPQEVAESDFLLDICGYTGDLLPLPEGLPTFFSFADPHCLPSGPDSSPTGALQAVIGHDFHLNDINVTSTPSPELCPSPSPSSSPSYDYPQCSTDARLVPDNQPALSMCDGLLECAFHSETLDRPLGDQVSAGSHTFPQHVASDSSHPATSLTSDPSSSSPPATTASTAFALSPGNGIRYSEQEQEEISILAQQISSLASSFDKYRAASCLQGPESRSSRNTACDSSGSSASPLPDLEPLPPTFRWNHYPAPHLHPLRPELVLDEGVVDSILKGLDRVPGADALTCCPAEGAPGPRNGRRTLGAPGTHSDTAFPFGALAEDASYEQLSWCCQWAGLTHLDMWTPREN